MTNEVLRFPHERECIADTLAFSGEADADSPASAEGNQKFLHFSHHRPFPYAASELTRVLAGEGGSSAEGIESICIADGVSFAGEGAIIVASVPSR